ncbi:hypothetical protein ACGFJ7_29875 [Actinoplanes sp. NPDC048988]
MKARFTPSSRAGVKQAGVKQAGVKQAGVKQAGVMRVTRRLTTVGAR